jgi:hypothetical protein
VALGRDSDPGTFEGCETRGRVSVDAGRYYEVVAVDLRGGSRRPRVAVVIDVEEVYTVNLGGTLHLLPSFFARPRRSN